MNLGKKYFQDKVVKNGISWTLDIAKGRAIDAIALTAMVIGPTLLSNPASTFIQENLILTIGGTYILYILSRALGSWSDIRLQEKAGFSTNAWGNTLQAFFDKENKRSILFQGLAELAKAIVDEVPWLSATLARGALTAQIPESIVCLNIGTIVGYLTRVILQENPLTYRLLNKIALKKDTKVKLSFESN